MRLLAAVRIGGRARSNECSSHLHAFRHGLATELVESNAPLSVLQKQMRHADIATTLRIDTHAIPQSQRDAMEAVGLQSVGSINTVIKFAAK